MSDNQNDDNLNELMPSVSEDRPLDSMVPEMRTLGGAGEGAPSDVPPVHPRVLEVGLESGSEWTMAIWSDPHGAVAERVVSLLRATLTMEMSKPPTADLLARDFQAVRLLVFAELADQTIDRLEQFGFEQVEYAADQYEERMGAWRKEAAAADIELPGAPASVWRLNIAHLTGSDAQRVKGVARELTDRLDGQPWGATPGGVSRLLARRLESELDVDIGMDVAELDRMIDHLVPDVDHAIRWVPPVVFQALCDYVGVVAHGQYERKLQWGLCEETDEGLVPPPTFREPSGDEANTIPIGRVMVDWLVFPKLGGEGVEQIPVSRRVASLLEPNN
jgi:hypothetical protein